jgi:integrase/recombinase XerD
MLIKHTLKKKWGKMKKQKSKTTIAVHLVQKPDGSWKIKKGPDWKKAEKILKESVTTQASPQTKQNHLQVFADDKAHVESFPVEAVKTHSTLPAVQNAFPTSYRKTLEMKEEAIWNSLAKVKLKDAMDQWLDSILNPQTKESYQFSMDELIARGFLNSDWSLQQFSLISPDMVIDSIKTKPLFIRDKKGSDTHKQWSMRTREARIACFLAFTRYLSRKTEGIIRRGVPSKDGIEKTFSIKPRKVKSEAMSRSQILTFLEELDKINPRDGMIARLCLHGGKRINEVLSLKTDQIDYEKKRIIFHQSKSKFTDDFTVISFERPATFVLLNELKAYIGERKDLVFVTTNGKELKQNQVDRNFMKAGRRAGIPFRVSPHNLRATAVTLWKEDGFQRFPDHESHWALQQ